MKGIHNLYGNFVKSLNSFEKENEIIKYTFKGEVLFFLNKRNIFLPKLWRIDGEVSIGFNYAIDTLVKLNLIKVLSIEINEEIAKNLINKLHELYVYDNKKTNIIKLSKTNEQVLEILCVLYNVAKIPQGFRFNQHIFVFVKENEIKIYSNSKLDSSNFVKNYKELTQNYISFENKLFTEAISMYYTYANNYKNLKRISK